MRALTFVQAATGRGVIAFRGTDLNRSGVSGQADMCADDVLSGKPLRAWCKRFTNETLDYLTRAIEFAQAAEGAFPGIEWLYTGHSLGAQLAEVLAAIHRARALTFAAPSVSPVLRNRTVVDPALVSAWSEVALYNEWDPLLRDAQGNLVGAECIWEVRPPPLGCETCYSDGKRPDLLRPECAECFARTHVYKKYLDLVGSGQRPACRPADSDTALVYA